MYIELEHNDWVPHACVAPDTSLRDAIRHSCRALKVYTPGREEAFAHLQGEDEPCQPSGYFETLLDDKERASRITLRNLNSLASSPAVTFQGRLLGDLLLQTLLHFPGTAARIVT